MWPALIAAGAQVAGGLIGKSGTEATNRANAQQVAQTNAFNAEEAQRQRQFEERMSDTQYQRAVADMRAAGLNPALAYQQGGAGTPSGASASGQSARMENSNAQLGSAIGTGAATALDIYNQVQQAKLTQAQTTAAQAQAYRTMVEGGRTQLETNLFGSDEMKQLRIDTMRAQLRSILTNAAEASARTGLAGAATKETDTRRLLESQGLQNPDYRKYVAPWMNSAKDILKTINPISALISAF